MRSTHRLDNHSSQATDSDNESVSTITGRYLYIPNPCITVPCLPGMVYALCDNERCYYLTIHDNCFSENHTWDDYTPEINDVVTVNGNVREKKDFAGEIFYTIEIERLQRGL